LILATTNFSPKPLSNRGYSSTTTSGSNSARTSSFPAIFKPACGISFGISSKKSISRTQSGNPAISIIRYRRC